MNYLRLVQPKLLLPSGVPPFPNGQPPQSLNLKVASFLEKAIAKIRTVTVDNSEATILGRGEDKDKDYEGYKYVCNNTHDKLFLLSESEVTKESYGFDKYDRGIGDDEGTKTSSRTRKATDYSKAKGVSYSTKEGKENNGWWWLRSLTVVIVVTRATLAAMVMPATTVTSMILF